VESNVIFGVLFSFNRSIVVGYSSQFRDHYPEQDSFANWGTVGGWYEFNELLRIVFQGDGLRAIHILVLPEIEVALPMLKQVRVPIDMDNVKPRTDVFKADPEYSIILSKVVIAKR
jgi:hypothetical protein